ncbi:alpha/beta hydrolase [Deinococcus lacus]|uniref:Alpha/beta hydrolase n=1 Tax=Deinococcus lacus TaxID=392561 RepID=A0ABW1YDA4_9DEIO
MKPTPRAHPWAMSAPVEGYAWKAADPRAAVLLTHGLGEYAGRYVTHYSQLIPALLDAGYDVYAYDQRGHGRSRGARAIVDAELLVADHFAAREALRRQPLPVYALGHSLGGLITAASAARDPRGLRGVILSSPALLVGADQSPWLRGAAPLLARLAPSLPAAALDTAQLSRLPSAVEAYKSDPQIYQGKVSVMTAASMMQLGRQLWALYPAWQLPVLAVHGTQDRYTDPDGTRRFMADIASPDKTLLEVEGGYHELLNDEGASETLAAILGWLDSRTPA